MDLILERIGRLTGRAVERADLLCGDDGWGNTPFSGGCFETVMRHDVGERDRLEPAVRQLPHERADEVLVIPVISAPGERIRCGQSGGGELVCPVVPVLPP